MRRPGIDAELIAPLAEVKALMPPLTLAGLSQLRALPSPPLEPLLEGRAIEHEELEVPGPDARVRQGGGQPRRAVLPLAVGVVAAGLGDRHRVRHASGDSFPDGAEGDVHPSS